LIRTRRREMWVGLAVYIEVVGFWDYETAPYLLGEYQSHDEMCDIAEYQKKRFYSDEVLNDNI